MRNSTEDCSGAQGRFLILPLNFRIDFFCENRYLRTLWVVPSFLPHLPLFSHCQLSYSQTQKSAWLSFPSARIDNWAVPNFSLREYIGTNSLVCHVLLCSYLPAYELILVEEAGFYKILKFIGWGSRRFCPGVPLLSLWFHHPTSQLFQLNKPVAFINMH